MYEHRYFRSKTVEAVNEERRAERAEMKKHGFKTMKAFKKYQKKAHRRLKEANSEK